MYPNGICICIHKNKIYVVGLHVVREEIEKKKFAVKVVWDIKQV